MSSCCNPEVKAVEANKSCNFSAGFTVQQITGFSFLFAFLALTFSTILTAVGAFRTEDTKYEIALTLETFISALAGYVYYRFLMDKTVETDITPYRYLDWLLTTPFLLLSLMVILNNNNPGFPWFTFLYVAICDIIMLAAGYLSEIGKIDKIIGGFVGFVALVGIFVLIINAFPDTYNQAIFWYFVALWVLYGIVFYLPLGYKTIGYNILDIAAKVAFGIWTWILSVGLF